MFTESKITEIYCMADDFLQRICIATGKIHDPKNPIKLTAYSNNCSIFAM